MQSPNQGGPGRRTLNNATRRQTQGGFTLVELAVVVAILAVLAYIFWPEQDPDKARAAKLYQALSTYTGAATTYRAEMGCYPAKAAFVAAKQPNATANTTVCGTDVTARFTNPYVQNGVFDTNNALSLDAVAAGATAQIVVGTAVGGVTPVSMRLTPLTNSLANRLATLCNGSVGTGNCTVTAVTGSTTQSYVDYKFGQF